MALPAEVVTTTFTAPALLAGVVAVIEFALDEVTVAAIPPKVTEIGELRFHPPITTEVPPAVVPVPGEIVLTPGSVVVGARSTPAPHTLVVHASPIPVGNVAAAAWICAST